MNARREYILTLTFNMRIFTRVIIDCHYEINHPDITDTLILDLVRAQNGKEQEPSSVLNGFSYFRIVDCLKGKFYRLILTYCEEDFLGVINAFRVEEVKNDKMA